MTQSPIRSILLAMAGALAPFLFEAIFGADPNAPVESAVFTQVVVWVFSAILTTLGVQRAVQLAAARQQSIAWSESHVKSLGAVAFLITAIVLIVAAGILL